MNWIVTKKYLTCMQDTSSKISYCLGIDVNYSLKKTRTQSPARRIISILTTVIWLVTVMQPCAMASVVDPELSKVETHHTIPVQDKANSGNHGCAHCDASGSGDNHCDSETHNMCDNDGLYVHSERTKPVDNEKFHGQQQSFMLFNNQENELQHGQLVPSEIVKSSTIPQGPKLADLYCVYLK